MCTKNELDKANRLSLFLMLNTGPKDFDEQQFINNMANNYDVLYEQMKKDCSKNNLGKNNPCYGKKRSEETKEKMSKSRMNRYGKPVICLETLKIYNTCSEAARDIGTVNSNICQCCIKEYYTVFGLHFRYYDENIDYTKVTIPKLVKPYNTKSKKKVKCIESGIVYDSIKQASEKTRISDTSISKCCNGHYKKAGGYHWEFVE